VTLREENRLRVFENRMLMRMFAQRKDEVTREWRKLHNEELPDMYSSSGIIRIIKSRRMIWSWHVARIGEKRITYRLLVGRPEGKRPLGVQIHRLVANIEMDLGEIEWGAFDQIGLPQNKDKWRAAVIA
jgi:hypothetical protein